MMTESRETQKLLKLQREYDELYADYMHMKEDN